MRLADYRSILIYGGSFDPPHLAHKALPEVVREKVGCDVTAYIPCASQPLKQNVKQTPAEHRLAMLKLLLADQPTSIVLTDEMDRAADGRPSYTVDTLRGIRERFPGRLRLLIGTDQLAQFDKWRDWQTIIEIAEPAVMVRPPESVDSVKQILPDGFDWDVWQPRIVEAPLMRVSSTELRKLLADGKQVDHLTTDEVTAYIREHGLYR